MTAHYTSETGGVSGLAGEQFSLIAIQHFSNENGLNAAAASDGCSFSESRKSVVTHAAGG
jgi:hypothetical protein